MFVSGHAAQESGQYSIPVFHPETTRCSHTLGISTAPFQVVL